MERLLAALLLLLLLVAIVAPATRQEPPEITPPALPADDWRRTTSGWEHASRWEDTAQTNSPPRNMHPALLAALCLLVSVGALVGFSDRDYQSPTSASTRRMFSMLSRASRSTPGS